MADGQPFVIRELGVADPITLTLANENAPHVGLSNPVVARSKQRFYPHSASATVQGMGWNGEPIELSGRLRDEAEALLGQAPKDYLATMQALVARESLCRLSWGTTLRPIGRVTRVTPNWILERDIEYTLVFEVDQMRIPGVRPVSRRVTSLNRFRAKLQEGVAGFRTAAAAALGARSILSGVL